MENRLICMCKGVTLVNLVDAVKEGSDTLDKIKNKTGAATGRCGGCRCVNQIENIIENNK